MGLTISRNGSINLFMTNRKGHRVFSTARGLNTDRIFKNLWEW
jgi:hypothetical protein